jgi:two-component system sensor histidine kinase KdpD
MAVGRRARHAGATLTVIAAITLALKTVAIVNHTTIALTYLLVVLFVAAASELWLALTASVVSMLCVNFFFLPPVGTFAVVDPENWVALTAFLTVSVVASHLSASARARETERRAAELAHQRAELSSALLASLSHDLRTPLTAIRTAVDNLDTASLSEVQRREQARVASGQLDRLTRQFEEILDMARIEAGAVEARREWTTPAEVVEAGLSNAAPVLANRDLRVDAPDDVGVEIDPRLTSSALVHLLENAARYAVDGPIVVRSWTEAGLLRLDVSDSGPGLQTGELERLFEPFYRGERVRQRIAGTGMGLAIARGLLAAEGGRVWAASPPSGGACFSIAIPARTRPLPAAD